MNKNSSIFTVVSIAVFTAVLIVLSQIAIPLPSGIPITLQTFAVALCGYVLGVKKGLSSVAAYIAMGAVGLPVFHGFKGGIGMIAGVTGGFIWGFLFLALLCGISKKMENPILSVALGMAGMAACYLFGTLQFAIVTSRGFLESLAIAVVPYIIKDIISVILAFSIAIVIEKSLKKSGIKV